VGAGGDFFCHGAWRELWWRLFCYERVLMETFLPREGADVETGADFGNIYNQLMNSFQNRYFQLMARDVLEKEKRIHI